MTLKYLIQDFHLSLSKNYGSLTHETRIKDAVNMEDFICLLATVRTLKAILVRLHFWESDCVNNNDHTDMGSVATSSMHLVYSDFKRKKNIWQPMDF